MALIYTASFVAFNNKHHDNKSVKVDTLTPHFYIVKLWFTGVYIIFLFLLQNIDCGYLLKPSH